ncbi:hypothetical protein DL765_009509 [Monosporascus sp. GIB2]|nr:hypothetical protein DL765_009509 [Monosporascus sp. GIB2]
MIKEKDKRESRGSNIGCVMLDAPQLCERTNLECDLGPVQEKDEPANPGVLAGVLEADEDFSKSESLQDSEQ